MPKLVDARFRRRRAPAAALCAVAMAAVPAACSVGPRYAAPDSKEITPAGYSTSAPDLAAGAPADRWWAQLGDTLLDELVERALSGNPDLAAAEARVQQARALARVAGAAFYPSANLAAQVSRDKLSRHGENLSLIPFTPPTTEFTDYRAGIDASWEIDFAGKTRREVEAAIARLGGSSEARNNARAVIAAEVADAYVDYREAVERIGLAGRTRVALAETLRLVKLEENAGLASELDRRRAGADSLNADAVIPPLDAQRQSALFKLAALTGERSESLARRLEEPHAIPAVPATTAVGLPSEILRRRPDIRRAERDLAAATADVGGAIAAQYPRFSLLGDFGFDSVRTGQFASAASRYWNLTPSLTLPLFAGGRLRGNVQAAEAARDAALASYRSTVLQALADTESSLVRYSAARRRAANLADGAATLDAALDLERRRYAAGDSSMIDVLAAEHAASEAADQDAAGRAQLAREYFALGKALGGGWQAEK